MNTEKNIMLNQNIKIIDILYLIMRRKWMIFSLMLVFTLSGYIYSNITYVQVYSATSSMVVNTNTSNNTSGTPVGADIYLAQNLVDTYTLILKSDRVTQYVVEKLELDLSTGEIASYISLSAAKDTQILYATVTCTQPELAVAIANTIMEVAPKAMTETVGIGSVNVLDVAKASAASSSKEKIKTAIYAGIIGMVLGMGIAFLWGIFKNNIKNASDVEEKFLIPSLGEIIHIRRNRKKDELLLNSPDVPASFMESFLMLSTIINHVSKNNKVKKLLITSSLEDEGKTNISINLAIALSESGKSVLLVDCDLRKPKIYKRLKIFNKDVECFGDTLFCSQENIVLNKSIYKSKYGFSVIPFLNRRGQYNNIFKTSVFNKAIDTLSDYYDYIIFDSAPAYSVADTMDLINVVDGVVLVIKQEHASARVVGDTIKNLKKVGANLIGFVLNDIRYHNLGSGYTYKYKHYYKSYSYKLDKNLFADVRIYQDDGL